MNGSTLRPSPPQRIWAKGDKSWRVVGSKLTIDRIRSIAWNPTGALIASGATDKTVRVWNPERSNVRYSTELKGHEAGVEKVAFNPSMEAILCSVGLDGTAKFWDARSKVCINEVKGLGEAFTLAWEPKKCDTVIVGNKVGLN
jgi:THO complex subunit 3